MSRATPQGGRPPADRQSRIGGANPALTAAAHLVGRVLIVFALLPNGFRKIATFDLTAGMMGGAPPQMVDGRMFPPVPPLITFPMPELFLAASLTLDIVGALLIMVGWRTRAVAVLLAGYCVLAMAIYHGRIDSVADLMPLLRNMPLVGGLLVLAAVGAGAWSVDAWLARRRSAG
jgi:putative oxidoreductase